jgi:hypothetical protein
MADARDRCDRETASIAFPESTMQSLSPMDGSAAAVRQAATAVTAVDDPARLAVERELDRLNIAAIAQVSALAQHMSGMLLVQAILLAAYFGVLIGGWSLPLPGKRWLLVAVAVSAAVSLLAAHLGLRAQIGRIGALRRNLRSTEAALEQIAGRTPVLARSGFTAGIGRVCVSALPWLLVVGWISLVLYALALPPAPEQRVASETRSDTRDARAPAATEPRAARAAPKSDEPAPSAEAAAPDNESPLAAFLRRAASASASAPEPGERVTP